MAIQSNFPAIRPSLLLDFANSKRLDPRITFTRASTARFYDGSTVAKAEENLLLRSQAFNQSSWGKTALTATDNSTTAPDGTATASLITAGAGSTQKWLQQAKTASSGSTFSVFAKKGTHSIIQLCYDASVNRFANFDLDAGVIGTIGSGYSASIASVGDGWYRCSVTATSDNAAVCYVFVVDSTTAGYQPNSSSTGTFYLWGAQLENRLAVTAYTATTTAPITNYVPVLQTAAAGVPRFDHNPTTGESLGLLIEDARTNLCLQSETFSTTWTTDQSTLQANVVVAPDGTLTADRLFEDTASAIHAITQSITKAASAITYSFSCYVRSGGRNVRLYMDGGSSTNRATASFDLSAGTVNVAAAVAGTFASPSASVTAVGNGWYRCVLTATTGTETTIRVRLSTVSGTTDSYTGDGWSSIALWGAQLEVSSFYKEESSYIPTTSAAVTRQADIGVMTGTNFSSWYRSDEGTLYGEAYRNPASMGSLTNFFVQVDDTTANNAISLNHNAQNTRLTVQTNGVNQVAANVTNGFSTGRARIAGAYKLNDFRQATGGTLSTADTSGTIPVVSRLVFQGWQGTITKFAYYPLRLTDAQLQAITG